MYLLTADKLKDIFDNKKWDDLEVLQNITAQEQLHHVAVKLLEPCTEHPMTLFNTEVIDFPYPLTGIVGSNVWYHKFRKDCPQCIAKLNQEAGVE